MPTDKYKILVIDDSEENRLILSELCRTMNYEVLEMENGKLAKDTILSGYTPSIVLCDINMPEMDGYQFLEFIKKESKLKETPVLMVTSVDETDSVIKCLKLGAEDYITKPIEPEILKARIENSLKRAEFLNLEKSLLEKTFSGSIKVFSDILSLLSPQIFGKSARIRRYARDIAEELEYPEIWEIEVSAMFSLIGCISLPQEISDKIINGKPLVGEEKILFNHHPTIGHKLLKNIPRLENVAINILHQNESLESLPTDRIKKEDSIPLGAQIIKAAFAYDSLADKVMSANDLIFELKKKTGLLSPRLVNALEGMIQKDQRREAKDETVATLKAGMFFAEDCFTMSGAKVAGQWQEVTQTFIERLMQIHTKMPIKEPIKVFLMSKQA